MEIQKRQKSAGVFNEIKITNTLSDAQLAEAMAITSFALGGNSPDDFSKDFPVWKRVGQDEHRGVYRFAAIQSGAPQSQQVIGAAFLRMARVWINDGHSLPVAIIGGVSVKPEMRGKGIGSKLLTAVTSEIDKQRIPLTVLWGIPSKLYQQYGFTPLTGQIEVLLEEALLQSENSATKESLSGKSKDLPGEWVSGYHFDIFQKRIAMKEGLALQKQDVSWYSLHSRVQWWRYLEKGQMKAYFGIGRGIDLAGIIHEWWSERAEEMPKYLSEVCKKTNAHALIASSRHRQYFIQNGYTVNDQTLCLARVSGPLAVKDLASIWFWGLDSA